MTVTVQTSPPAQIIAGDSVAFTISLSDYAAPTWALTWTLAGASVLSESSTDNANGVDHDVALTGTETAALAAGTYQWRLRATDGTTTTTVSTGVLTVTPDLGAAQPGDAVSFYEKTIPILEAALSGTLSGEMRSYMIAGRQVVTFTPKELLAMLDDFTARRDIAAGAGFGTPVRWSFQSATTGGGSISPAEWVSS